MGGRGGRGNFSFKTSRDRAPTIAEKGEKGEELWVDLELKVRGAAACARVFVCLFVQVC